MTNEQRQLAQIRILAERFAFDHIGLDEFEKKVAAALEGVTPDVGPQTLASVDAVLKNAYR